MGALAKHTSAASHYKWANPSLSCGLTLKCPQHISSRGSFIWGKGNPTLGGGICNRLRKGGCLWTLGERRRGAKRDEVGEERWRQKRSGGGGVLGEQWRRRWQRGGEAGTEQESCLKSSHCLAVMSKHTFPSLSRPPCKSNTVVLSEVPPFFFSHLQNTTCAFEK